MKDQLSRTDITRDQQLWEARRGKEFGVRVVDEGRYEITGVNMHSLADIIGPERHARFLQQRGLAEIAEPKPSILQRLKQFGHKILQQ